MCLRSVRAKVVGKLGGIEVGQNSKHPHTAPLPVVPLNVVHERMQKGRESTVMAVAVAVMAAQQLPRLQSYSSHQRQTKLRHPDRQANLLCQPEGWACWERGRLICRR